MTRTEELKNEIRKAEVSLFELDRQNVADFKKIREAYIEAKDKLEIRITEIRWLLTYGDGPKEKA